MNQAFIARPNGQTASSLVRNFSIEVLPADVARHADFQDHLPNATRVYVAYTSGSTSEIVDAVEKLSAQGMTAVPHIPARRFASHEELRSFLAALTSRAAVTQALLIGGDIERPAGPYASSLDVLHTGMLQDHGIKAVGFAGHPEGHPSVSHDELRRALIDKCEYASKAGIDVSITTQFLFDTAKLLSWHDNFVEKTMPGIAVDVGLPGMAKMTTLLRFAKECGVGTSLGMLSKNFGRALKLATSFSPEDALVELAEGMSKSGTQPFRSVHFYPFGSFARTTEWLRTLQNADAGASIAQAS